MENNIGDNMNTQNNMDRKKNNPVIMVIIVILILAIIAIIAFRKINMGSEPKPELELDQAITTDSTTSINSNLDSINMENTSEVELQEVDKELENL